MRTRRWRLMGGACGRACVQLLEKSAIEQFPVPEAVQVLVPTPFALPEPISPTTHVIQLDSWPRPCRRRRCRNIFANQSMALRDLWRRLLIMLTISSRRAAFELNHQRVEPTE